MSKQKFIAIIVVLIAVAAGVYLFVYKDFKISNPKSENLGAPALGENPVDKSNLTETYTSPDYGFSFKYPKGFNATELDDDSGHTVLVQNAEEKSGFQVYITPFDEADPLTAARILEDLPASEVIDPKDVLIGEGKAINAVIFLSTNPSFGRTREVWFIREGFLYQVTTYEGQDDFIGPILETLRFEN